MNAPREFAVQTLDDELKFDLQQLVALAIREDLDRSFDLTTVAIVPEGLPARASIAARQAGTAAGVSLVEWILEAIGTSVSVECNLTDGTDFNAGDVLATLEGDARDVLTCERTILNFLGRLCGIATQTRRFTSLIEQLECRLYDTRKTTPGWRRLEKYAVNCGGGCNHRSGLHDAILIKDNHLACHAQKTGQPLSPKMAVEAARRFLNTQPDVNSDCIVEIEVDTLGQLQDALPAAPDIVLLDNMSLDQLREAVAMRNATNPTVQLEASGGVNLDTIRGIGETGVDRISVGALTHSAINLDLGLDWSLGTLPQN